MADSQSHAVKSLNTASVGRRRFVFKNFSQRVEEIDINVFRSIETVKAQPSSGSSFFRETLDEWRELNTTEHFISFYEEMKPVVQTLPQVFLHREKIFSELLGRLNMEARLSLEPILRLLTALARDILDQFVPLLRRLIDSLVDLLENGGDHDPEILEQVFTSWSYIVMYLQKYITRDVLYVLEITLPLRFYSKDYVREFMAETISFLLRNAPIDQLSDGIKKTLLEVAESYADSGSSYDARRKGVVAMLWHIMRGVSSRLHSRTEIVFSILIDKSNFPISDCYPQASEAITEVITGVIDRLCTEINPKELKIIHKCFLRSMSDSMKEGSSVHLKYLLYLVKFTISMGRVVFDKEKLLELIHMLTQAYMKPADCTNSEDSALEVLSSIIQLMLSLLDVPVISDDLPNIVSLYRLVFELRSSSRLTFIRGLIDKDSYIVNFFQSHMLRVMDDMIEESPEKVLFLMFKFFEKLGIEHASNVLGGCKPVKVLKMRKYFKETILYWVTLLSDVARHHDKPDEKIAVAEVSKVSVLWGVLSCFCRFQVLQDDLALLENFITELDKLLISEVDGFLDFPKSTWQSILGAAVSSYLIMLQKIKSVSSETVNFMLLANNHKSSPQVLTAVADFFDYVLGSGSRAEGCSDNNAVQEPSQRVLDSLAVFADNLRVPNKMIRISTLRILSHCELLGNQLSDEHPEERLRMEDSGSDFQETNVIEHLLSIERTPISISTSRKFVVLISKLQRALTFGKINDSYIPLLLSGIIGILHNQFSHIWEPAMECLATLLQSYKDLVWSMFAQYLQDFQSKSLSSSKDVPKVNAGSLKSISLVDCFNSYLASENNSTPCAKIVTLLLQSLQKIPHTAESRSRQLVPLFLKFMGYNDGVVVSVESYDPNCYRGLDWKNILMEWLSLFGIMRHAQSLYQIQNLKEVLIERLLDNIDPDIQSKVMDCILNWEDKHLTPYSHHLKNLIVSKKLREELASWAISRESKNIPEEYRCHLIPIVIKILIPKVQNLKALGSRKHTGVSYRRAILCFLSQLDVEEVQLFFSYLLKPLAPESPGLEVFDFRSVGKSKDFEDQSQKVSLVKSSTVGTVSDISWKRISGFLHVVEDILGTFDELHLQPYLSPLLLIVVRVLERCMLDIANLSEKNVSSGKLANPPTDEPSHLFPDSIVVGDANPQTGLDNFADRKEDYSLVKQIKDIRSLCLKMISYSLSKYDSDYFGSNFWNIFFCSIKPLIDSFKQEGSSSEKPSSLFSCFLAMSRSVKLAKLLEREADLVPNIFSMLTVRTSSDAILSCVLDFIENLLILDNELDFEEGDCFKLVLPHLGVLIHSFRVLLQSREYQGKSKVRPHTKELRIFKLLAKYIHDSLVAEQFLDILLQLFTKKDANSEECLEALHVVKVILPVLVPETYGRIMYAIHRLLISAGLEHRLCICDILDGLKTNNPSIGHVARLLRALNAVCSTEINEPDYNTIVSAYQEVTRDLPKLREEQTLVILSQCIYDMSSGEFIIRQSASTALMSFVEYAGSVLNEYGKDSSAMSFDDSTKNDLENLTSGQSDDEVATWTSCTVQLTVKKIIIHHIGEAMNNEASIQKEWISVLQKLVCNLQEIPCLKSLESLCSEDPEVDFFNNIVHLQIHRRRRALSRFRDVIRLGNLSEEVTVKIFLPMFYNMLFNVKDGKGEDLRNACVETLADISRYISWQAYRSFLMRCFREMVLKPERQKILLRLICAVINSFHFYYMNSPEVQEEGHIELSTSDYNFRDSSNEFQSPMSSNDLIVPGEIQLYLQKAVLPKIQKLLKSDSEKVNVNINLAFLKLLKLLPGDTMESHLSSIIHRICGFLKHRFESVRGEARSALAACVKELGLEYLHFVIKVLQAILKRGYELHVFGYTLNFILSKTLVQSAVGKLDYCLEELLSVVENDILGDVAEQKEVDKIASKMKETRKNKSFETMKLISQCVSFGTHAMKLLLPINLHLQKHVTPKIKAKLEMMLHHIALGFEGNPSASSAELLVFVYLLIDDTIVPHGEKTTMSGSEEKTANSHLISVFALGLLHNCLKKIKIDEQFLSRLDPFVELLGYCLYSKYEDVLSATFRCLSLLIKLPLPSLQAQADKIKIILLEIVQKSGNGNSSLVQSCLKLLKILLRHTTISLSDNQLLMLIQSPLFIDIQTKPSPLALSLLESIVAKKLVIPQIYDIVVLVAELMVITHSDPIRKRCRKIELLFLRNYRDSLSSKRLQQHLNLIIGYLSYEHSSGREAALEMLLAILVNIPMIIDSQAQLIFLRLVEVLANENDSKIQDMTSEVIKLLIRTISRNQLFLIRDFSVSWYKSDKRNLWSASAQVLGLLVEVFKKGFQDHIADVLQIAGRILEFSVHTSREINFSGNPELPFWKETYHTLIMLEKILLQFPEMYFDREREEMWLLICRLLVHPHILVRNTCSQLVASYFSAISECKRTSSCKLYDQSLFLMSPGRLFFIAVSLLSQLKSQSFDDVASNLLTQNVAFIVCHLHSFAKQAVSFNSYWSSSSSKEQDFYLEGFKLLGSQKAKSAFLLYASTSSHLPEGKAHVDNNEASGLHSFLLSPLIRRMGKLALQMQDIQTKVVFNCFKVISWKTGKEGCNYYGLHMLLPLYKVCEGFAGKIITDESKQLAEEVRDQLRDLVGVEAFIEAYNNIRKSLKERRDKRRREEKLAAVADPERHAKRKLRMAEKHRAHKRRKIMAMKMGRWKRC